ncbi:MAG: hypothetical protein EXR50_07400 [Dehalococcoidia bacterium]|nr:hypothetical protein [Dehalococcoidia bacterium]
MSSYWAISYAKFWEKKGFSDLNAEHAKQPRRELASIAVSAGLSITEELLYAVNPDGLLLHKPYWQRFLFLVARKLLVLQMRMFKSVTKALIDGK